MSEQRFPKGWDEQRVQKLIAELDARTNEQVKALIQKEIDEQWQEDEDLRTKVGVWTDDFSNLFALLKWHVS